MRILVTGISGAIGAGLTPALLGAGHDLAALTRNPESPLLADLPARVVLHTGDAVSGTGLDRALADVEVAYYLIHSMEPGPSERFEAREHLAAENFARAAIRAGVRRIIYLGGLVPRGHPSQHLASRLAVERVLLDALPESIALRASIVIGARSRSFRFLVRLIERLPILIVPGWGSHRTTPVDQRDVIRCLAGCADAAGLGGRSLDLVGPETLTYQLLIERIRDHLLLARPALRLSRVELTPIASRLSAAITGEDHALIGPLMRGLSGDLLASQELATDVLAVAPHRLDAAIEHALREWEATEQLAGR